eukprot:TRINITY_DN130_c5_g1_i1.p1 TRINITY_DN130_c5_g1~~TRINITY_DN130_c5_g1_i1.p1  ORF type:complete len:467 (+),score=104.60 TRINITY_DN130_c5_g1_i1:50-1402(+)
MRNLKLLFAQSSRFEGSVRGGIGEPITHMTLGPEGSGGGGGGGGGSGSSGGGGGGRVWVRDMSASWNYPGFVSAFYPLALAPVMRLMLISQSFPMYIRNGFLRSLKTRSRIGEYLRGTEGVKQLVFRGFTIGFPLMVLSEGSAILHDVMMMNPSLNIGIGEIVEDGQEVEEDVTLAKVVEEVPPQSQRTMRQSEGESTPYINVAKIDPPPKKYLLSLPEMAMLATLSLIHPFRAAYLLMQADVLHAPLSERVTWSSSTPASTASTQTLTSSASSLPTSSTKSSLSPPPTQPLRINPTWTSSSYPLSTSDPCYRFPTARSAFSHLYKHGVREGLYRGFGHFLIFAGLCEVLSLGMDSVAETPLGSLGLSLAASPFLYVAYSRYTQRVVSLGLPEGEGGIREFWRRMYHISKFPTGPLGKFRGMFRGVAISSLIVANMLFFEITLADLEEEY